MSNLLKEQVSTPLFQGISSSVYVHPIKDKIQNMNSIGYVYFKTWLNIDLPSIHKCVQ